MAHRSSCNSLCSNRRTLSICETDNLNYSQFAIRLYGAALELTLRRT